MRVIEEKTFKRVGGTKEIRVDARIICTTNRLLEQAIRQGQFREDLYFRLKIIPLYMPPLRARIEDVPSLAEHFVNMFNREFKKKINSLSPSAVDALKNYHWTGNIRELRNVIERAIILGETDTIEAKDLALDLGSLPAQDQPSASHSSEVSPQEPGQLTQGLNLRTTEVGLIK